MNEEKKDYVGDHCQASHLIGTVRAIVHHANNGMSCVDILVKKRSKVKNSGGFNMEYFNIWFRWKFGYWDDVKGANRVMKLKSGMIIGIEYCQETQKDKDGKAIVMQIANSMTIVNAESNEDRKKERRIKARNDEILDKIKKKRIYNDSE